MGRKIFVSYKYWDSDVCDLKGFTMGTPKVRDYVSWLEKKFNERTDHIYKGEQDNEDLSNRSDDYIWSKLKDRIYDSSITIVFISPNMKESYRWEKNQWIPWEVSYSLKQITRNDYTSRANAILAVILPNRKNDYTYYHFMSNFKIISENIKCGYIPVVTWDEFKYNCDKYIELAYTCQKRVPISFVRRSV